jgi:hypothetical protein
MVPLTKEIGMKMFKKDMENIFMKMEISMLELG